MTITSSASFISTPVVARIDFPGFYLTHDKISGLTTTFYPDNTCCPCPVVPDDQIHAYQLSIFTNRSISPQRHRLEHEIWHHLVGIYIYNQQSSPIIYREAHQIAQPKISHDINRGHECNADHGHEWMSPAHEEWLVAALCHRLHGDHSYDYGAYRYLTEQYGIDVDLLISIAIHKIGGVYDTP